MTLTLEKVKAIPIRDVMDRLGVEYYRAGTNEFKIKIGNDKTSGRGFNTESNLISDLSGKGRAQGSVIDVVKHFQSLDTKEAILRLKKEFRLGESETQRKSPFDDLMPMGKKGQQYLQGRGIDYNQVRDFVKRKNGIAVPVYKNSTISGVVIRHLTKEKGKRFSCVSGTDGKAIYQYLIDESKPNLYVVEGMFDFLTLRQHTNNVVGLRSATDGIEEVKRLASKFNVVLIPHNDEAGGRMVEAFQNIDHSVFRVGR